MSASTSRPPRVRSFPAAASDTRPLEVSVVVVSYNGRQYLPDLLESLLDQDFSRDLYEIVVADNDSQD